MSSIGNYKMKRQVQDQGGKKQENTDLLLFLSV